MPSRQPIADLLRRLVAVGGIALVLALTVFAASPSLHEQLHGATQTAHDDSCAVVLYAHGVSLPLAAPTAPLPPCATAATAPALTPETFLCSPHHLHPPERGPPLV